MYEKWLASSASEKFFRKKAAKVFKNVNFLNKSEIRGEQPPCCNALGVGWGNMSDVLLSQVEKIGQFEFS